jgi:hypothetical protein
VASRKRFVRGAAVEVSREVGDRWERAIYVAPSSKLRAHHKVRLRSPQTVVLSGLRFQTLFLVVPTQRIRAAKGGSCG